MLHARRSRWCVPLRRFLRAGATPEPRALACAVAQTIGWCAIVRARAKPLVLSAIEDANGKLAAAGLVATIYGGEVPAPRLGLAGRVHFHRRCAVLLITKRDFGILQNASEIRDEGPH